MSTDDFTPCLDCEVHGSGTITFGPKNFKVSMYRPTAGDPRHTLRWKGHDGKMVKARRNTHADAAAEARRIVERHQLSGELQSDDRASASPLTLLVDFLHPNELCPDRPAQLAELKGEGDEDDPFLLRDCGCRPDLDLGSRADYEGNLRRYVAPEWGKVETCSQLGPEHLKAVRSKAHASGRRESTINNVMKAVSSAVKFGLRQGYLTDPKLLEGMAPDRGKRGKLRRQGERRTGLSEKEVATWSEIERLSEAYAASIAERRASPRGAWRWQPSSEELFAAMPKIAAATGLRLGELLGLTTADIEFLAEDRAKIHVARQAAGPDKFKLPKGSKARFTFCLPEYVPLLRRVVDIAEAEHAQINVRMMENDRAIRREGNRTGTHLLFPKASNGRTGNAFCPSSFGSTIHRPGASRIWDWTEQEATDSDGQLITRQDGTVKIVRDFEYKMHGLRHRFAVECLQERDIDVVHVSNLLGHESVSITMDVYAAHPEHFEEEFYGDERPKLRAA